MGKGKNKAFKLKEYKVPPEKYVVVVNPWGLPEKLDMNTKLNEIGVWFELLLKKDYPSARVREIFYQKTHRNIIVELPKEVDITKYLGAYHYSQFHNNISPDDTRTAYIYEYRYATFGNPGSKNWTGIIPTNQNIPAGLLQVLKDPFPVPTPAPPPQSDTPYARPIPHNIQCALAIIRDAPLIASASNDNGKDKAMEKYPLPPPSSSLPPSPPPNVGSSCSFDLPSTKSLFTPYEPPSHYVAHVEASRSQINQQEQIAHELPQVKKMDPYEEEEMEGALLRRLSPVKKDESNEVIDFMNSFSYNVKSEEKPIVFPSREGSESATPATALTSDGGGDYKPSADLLDLFNTLPAELLLSTGGGSSTARNDVIVKSDTVLHHDGDSSSDRKDIVVKSEVVETTLTYDEEYRPSGELLAAFAGLPDTVGYDEQPIKREPQDSDNGSIKLRVKEEPTEIQLSGRPFAPSERKQLPRPSTSRATTMDTPPRLTPDNARYSSNVQVKPEPVDDPKTLFSSHFYNPVPRDPRRSLFPPKDGNSDSQSSTDPRKRLPGAVIKHERKFDNIADDEGSTLFRKRLKMEH